MIRLTMAKNKNSFLNGLISFGLSKNHDQLPKNIQFIEKLTRLRRLYPIEVLGDSFNFS